MRSEPASVEVAGFLEVGNHGQLILCDDDGVGLSMHWLRRFDGWGVKITVEVDPSLEHASTSTDDVPLMYERIGLTPSAYREERDRRKRRWCWQCLGEGFVPDTSPAISPKKCSNCGGTGKNTPDSRR